MSNTKNIILLSVDALRADHVSYHGYDRETTPFLDSIQDEAVTFSNAISASSHTRESVPSLITGHYPHEFADNEYHLVKPSIAERVSDRGFSTAAFHSNPYVSRAYEYDSGFDTFDDDLLLGRNRLMALAQRALDKFLLKKGNYHARAEEINTKSLNWLDSLGEEPFFLWNHYMDVHGPYNPPDEYRIYQDTDLSDSDAQALYQKCINESEEITDADQELLIDLYDGEIRYLDAYLRRFLTALEERGLRDESIIIITSDHGDAFGEYGYYTHPRQLHNILLHVPLLILYPQHRGREIDSVVSTLDIVPTILEELSMEFSSLPGQQLLNDDFLLHENHPKVAFSAAQGLYEDEGTRLFALQDDEWKLVIRRDLESNEIIEEDLYSIAQGEETPIELESDASSQVEKLRDSLVAKSGEQVATMTDGPDEAQEVSDEVTERLETLGYK